MPHKILRCVLSLNHKNNLEVFAIRQLSVSHMKMFRRKLDTLVFAVYLLSYKDNEEFDITWQC